MERASGIDFEENEIDQLLRELVDKSEQAATAQEKNTFAKKVAVENDKAAAEDQRSKAMEKPRNERVLWKMNHLLNGKLAIQVLRRWPIYERRQKEIKKYNNKKSESVARKIVHLENF